VTLKGTYVKPAAPLSVEEVAFAAPCYAPSTEEAKPHIFDEGFVRRLRMADPDAEREFYAHFSTVIWIKLRGSVRSPELIEDIRQETLLRVLRYLRSDKPLAQPERLGAFVHGVCKNVTLEMQRSHSRHPQLFDTSPEPVDQSASPEKELDISDRQELVREVLAKLSPKDREALGLVYLDEVDRGEACRRLQIAEGYFRVVLYRARLQFRKIIERKETHRRALWSYGKTQTGSQG
jgi:RNA polymerase sigma-70 factor (ECF subfamily)